MLDFSIATALVPSFSNPKAAPQQCCVGDMSCNCQQNCYGLCQHVEAVQQIAALDTPLRQATAAELITRGMITVVDAAEGICEAQHFCPPAEGNQVPFKLSLTTGICDCWDWLQSHMCCHLIAAHQLPDLQAIPAVMMMPLRTKPAIPSGPADDDDLCTHLQGMSQATAAFEAGHVGLHEQLQTQTSTLRRMNSKSVDLLSRLPAEAREAMLADIAADQGKYKHVADQSALQPSAVQAVRNQRRQETRKGTDRTHKALYPSRQHPAVPAGMNGPASKRQRLSGPSGKANVDADDKCPAIPRRPAQGRPVTNVSIQVVA